MQFDGFPVEKFKARLSGTIEITEEEGLAMRLDRVVVLLVAARIDSSPPKLLEEEGTAMITRVGKLEAIALLEGDLREMAMHALMTGDNNALQERLEFPETERRVDQSTGEIERVPVAAYAEPPVHDNDATDPQNDSPAPQNGAVTDTVPAVSTDEGEYFDVPPAEDDLVMTGKRVVGSVRDYRGEAEGGGGEGPKVGKVDFSDLESLGSTPTPAAPRPSGVGVPQGERVGSVYPPGHGKDKILSDFFEEDVHGG